jgi:hypothetical protein
MRFLRAALSRGGAREKRLTVVLDGRPVLLTVRREPRAKRTILRIAADGASAVATVPLWATFDEGVAAAHRNSEWILGRLDAVPPPIPFADGALIPILGQDHRIRHDRSGLRKVERFEGEIVVAGSVEHMPRRIADWLRAEARREISWRVQEKAIRLGRSSGRITLRDTRSRWGSCSAGGNLSFSWRLVMAPDYVLDYVVAHEVAHLAVRNHGAAFWSTVAELTETVDPARRWLKRHGRTLHRYG